MNEKWRELISKPEYGIKEERGIMVATRDGTKLSINIFRPDAPGKFPALLALSPYGKEEQELLLPPQPLYKSPIWDGNIEAGDTTELVPRGYVHIIGDVRGTGASEGEYYGTYTSLEGRDGADLVEWIAAQPWCDGNVGMVGYSYYSKIQIKVAIEQPPHLKCIFVSHVDADHYRESVYHGGILSLFPYGIWDGRHGTSGFAPRNAKSAAQRDMSPAEFERRRQELLNDADIKHYPNCYHLALYPHKNPRFFDMMMYQFDGPFYWDRSGYPYFDKIKVPIHVVGKCAHEGTGFWKVYAGINVRDKKLYVKAADAEERPWREDLDTLIRWYDHWLKGKDTGMMDEPPIKLFVMGINQFRFEKEWPLPGIEYTPCYLRRWEELSFEPELFQYEPDGFFQQPLFVSQKRDSVIYNSPPLAEDLACIGPAAIKFFASIDRDDTNWIISLADISPTGAETRLTKGYLKASHRELDLEKSTLQEPYHPHKRSEPVRPGEIYEYNIALGMVSNVFKAGHRIKLKIESMESPRDPEMQIHYHPHLPTSRTTVHKIYRDRNYRSHVLLPVIKQ
jgi:predicted acyl esterase